jgi:hypothetical protein
MCTLTFIPKEKGYLAGMNRDELLTREIALPPRVFVKNGVRAVYPRESSGGTWIACNSNGVLFALLNWNRAGRGSSSEKNKSRGAIIPELIDQRGSHGASRALEGLDLSDILPFRLIGIFEKEKTILEWRSNGNVLNFEGMDWAPKHWFSSSLSDRSAEEGRSMACAKAWHEPGAGEKEWLRNLHRSHVPAPGPFSVCVHRPDAATVSYTEVSCCEPQISMEYLGGNPCLKPGPDERASITLAEPPSTLTLP